MQEDLSTRRGRFVLAAALLLASPGTAPPDPPPRPNRARPFTHPISLTEIQNLPKERKPLLETGSEIWAYVPEWHDLRAMREKGLLRQDTPERGLGRLGDAGHEAIACRPYSPIVVFDKRTRKWHAVRLSAQARAVYPAKADPFNRSLIWFGCNDGPPGLHADYFARAIPRSVDAPLLFGRKPGGLGLLDVESRCITYFGPFMHLVSSRVYEIAFDEDAVYFWGCYPAASEINGISRYDRKTRALRPFPLATTGRAWVVTTLRQTERLLELVVLDNGEWLTRYRFDKKTLTWRAADYLWVSGREVPLRARPAEDAAVLHTLSTDMHYKPRAWAGRQKVYGHPLVLLEVDDPWCKVATSDNVEGWVKRPGVLDTLGFFKLTLDSYVQRPERGNAGPRFFLWRFHLYAREGEIRRAMALIDARANDAASEEAKTELKHIRERLPRALEALKGEDAFRKRADELQAHLRPANAP